MTERTSPITQTVATSKRRLKEFTRVLCSMRMIAWGWSRVVLVSKLRPYGLATISRGLAMARGHGRDGEEGFSIAQEATTVIFFCAGRSSARLFYPVTQHPLPRQTPGHSRETKRAACRIRGTALCRSKYLWSRDRIFGSGGFLGAPGYRRRESPG